LLERFRETSAYDRLSHEAGALGDRLVEELSTTAQQVVLPALLKKIKNWIGLDLSSRTPSMASNPKGLSSYEPATSRASEL
jgi:DNA mismatch repair protein MutH